MGSRIRTLLLRGLEYPSVETFEVEDTGKFQELVLWLEDTKVFPIAFVSAALVGAVRVALYGNLAAYEPARRTL
jgi:hypothetical protein